MTRWRLTVEFDGGPFMGWQRQDHGPSVQEALEQSLFRMTGELVTLHAAGRTDAGVHALAMTAHVDVAKTLTEHRLREGVNALVRPNPISVTEVSKVADDWHGGLQHQLAASGNFGQLLRRNYPVAIANRFGAEPEEEVTITGCLCTPLDLLADEAMLPRAEAGDLVAIFCAGAYGLSASPTAFLSQPMAREMLV